tara:strand:+ start:881 stop:1567 length:687 start_codon:yes stop_codon:yes gene_type:complete
MLLGLAAFPSQAEVLEQSGNFGGLDVSYRVILPDDYNPEQMYPAILHFAGGSQTWNIVERSTDSDWRQGAERDGYIVISPASPNGELYFQGADRIFPDFLNYILENFPVAEGKLHVTGHSNGGLSAFHIASLYPDYFISLSGYPGLLNGSSNNRLEALRPLCIFMHVGDRDPSWRSAMQAQYQALLARDYKIHFQIEEDQTHRLDVSRDQLGGRLFAELEQSRNGCGE